jgi:hypothetical protein
LLEADNRQAAISALLAELQVSVDAAVVDPSRTMIRISERLWTLVRSSSPEERSVKGSDRRGGAKHKQVR